MYRLIYYTMDYAFPASREIYIWFIQNFGRPTVLEPGARPGETDTAPWFHDPGVFAGGQNIGFPKIWCREEIYTLVTIRWAEQESKIVWD